MSRREGETRLSDLQCPDVKRALEAYIERVAESKPATDDGAAHRSVDAGVPLSHHLRTVPTEPDPSDDAESKKRVKRSRFAQRVSSTNGWMHG